MWKVKTAIYIEIIGRWFVSQAAGTTYHYHIEFQTKHEAGMVIRMFEYGFKKGKELSKYVAGEEIVIYIPNQIVI